MGRVIQVNRATKHDARFMAVIDSYELEGEQRDKYKEQRHDYWQNRLVTKQEINEAVFVARDGGMYLGYLALNPEIDGYDVRIGPCVKDRPAVESLLLAKAGVQIESISLEQLREPGNDSVGNL